MWLTRLCPAHAAQRLDDIVASNRISNMGFYLCGYITRQSTNKTSVCQSASSSGLTSRNVITSVFTCVKRQCQNLQFVKCEPRHRNVSNGAIYAAATQRIRKEMSRVLEKPARGCYPSQVCILSWENGDRTEPTAPWMRVLMCVLPVFLSVSTCFIRKMESKYNSDVSDKSVLMSDISAGAHSFIL